MDIELSIPRIGKSTLALGAYALQADGDPFRGPETPISALMSADPTCVARELSVETLTALLLERETGVALVIDEAGGLVGLVSTADLLREVQDRGDIKERGPLYVPGPSGTNVKLARGFDSTHLARATVEAIMTPSSSTLPESASIAQAAALMASEGVAQLPVLDRGRKVVGVITALDLMRWLARGAASDEPGSLRGSTTLTRRSAQRRRKSRSGARRATTRDRRVR